ncbi:hypothetical protein [Homoserinibacter sp. YIM 151385]|uniref:hypothetical protein n=1 Tax=Homoserinibacter sp. YIM 151385 TaxID=2985506 RepID=UPI0022F015FA|nr:hypothetical protein [Homoserinibacter sp. YIM 151385]WBU38122.1 hypothetical protein OF852_00635 [Homoserinibacter sp. YIM 151385]
MTRRRPALLLVPALAAALALAGCSVVDNAVQGAVDGAQEQLDQAVDDAISETLGGAGISRNGEVPPGFPTDAVPMIDGDVIGGGSAPEGGGWAVQLAVEGEGAFSAAATLLQDGGYRADIQNSDARSGFGTFTDDTYRVVLTQDGTTVTYVVAPL